MLQIFFSIFLTNFSTCEIKKTENKYFQNLDRIQIKQVVNSSQPVYFNKIPTKLIKKSKISN